MTDQDKSIKVDRMRYTKNKFSSNLALLAIIFDVFCWIKKELPQDKGSSIR